ncbi:TonB-dependent receptor [Chitinophaga horti]|uniref:TonB-dependent receptor n=1 Tax=Chitinophaga horti TaxID=2920382 RepID=A0ABY6IWD3_9BACT|nr:TonB-dependent receptor [Chitinophaga horti]UYQ91688.1 TonB-dependent receptor [Chitinophaga horti]
MKKFPQRSLRALSCRYKCPPIPFISGVTLLLVLVSLAATAQQKIAGTVKDSTGEYIIGVSVKLKNTNIGTVTDAQGAFSLSASGANNALIFSYVGYEPKEVAVTGSGPLNVILQPNRQQLSQVNVVAVGYGKQKKAYVTGAVASANLDAVRDAPNTNIIQSLQGNVPGLNVGPVTSAGSTPSISVRGQNTISGNQNVLIILDGVQYNNSLSSINPDDIASIDVLKDASSTAVYGAQAANGVLLITSRRGNANGKPRINLSTSYTTQNPSGNIRPLNREEYLNKVRDLHWDQAYLAPTYTEPNPAFNLANVVDLTMRNGNELVPTNFNWYDAATKNGFINDNQISISGATDKVNYLISGAYTNQSGFIINDLFKRTSLRINLESQATDWLKIGAQTFGSFVNADGAEPRLTAIFQMSPLLTPYNADGSYNPFPFNSVDPSPFLTYDVDDYERHNYLFGNVYAEVNFPFLKGLTYRVNFGNNGRQDKRYFASKYGGGQTGEAYKTNESYYDYTLDNILTYTGNFGKHNILATAVYGAIQRKYETTTATGIGFSNITLGYNNLSLATTQRTTSDGYEESLNYYMGRLNYTYNGRYLLTATVRRDGFSGFAANNKWGTFPSFSAGWILSEENFMKGINFLNYLKLRAGYGIAGNQTQRYFSLDQISSQPAYVFGDGGSTVFGQYISTLANPNLKWERTTETNFGIDFGVLRDRITGTFDYYNRETNDLLFSVQIPNITGYSTINTNVGRIGNKGFELTLNSKNIIGKDFSWNTTFNFSRNKSEVLDLLGGGDLIASNLFIGQPIGAIYGYQTAGIYQLGDEIPAGYFPGTYRVVDYNKDGNVNNLDRYVVGTAEPAYRFSVMNRMQYKDITLTFLVNSIQGGRNGYLAGNTPSIGRSDVNIRNGGIAGIQYWTPSHPNSPYPLFTGAAPTIVPGINESRSFVRLQDITLSYNLPSKIIKKAGIQNLNVYASGKNLVTLTKWKGWDPEITNGGLNPNGRPLLKGYSVGVNITL